MYLNNEATATIEVATTSKYRHEVAELQPDTQYHVLITAANELGEGYKGDMVPVRTLKAGVPAALYVWGYNQYSQLGLNEEESQENKFECKDGFSCFPVQNTSFGSYVYDMAAGNVSTLFTLQTNECTLLVSSGHTTVPNSDVE